jgi:hypothetical protein
MYEIAAMIGLAVMVMAGFTALGYCLDAFERWRKG